MNKTTKIKDFYRLVRSQRKNKKAVEMSLNVVITAVILLVVLIVVVAVFTRLFGREAKQLEGQISGLDDTDEDNIINMFDRCPCTEGVKDYDGCSSQEALDQAKAKPKPKTCP
ncbi:hypothetical protein KY332_03175 [Candidatus Woesearchaeota archaeon]|nr:hypothetical protein [Candidatus Woesearchaeota archaeon]